MSEQLSTMPVQVPEGATPGCTIQLQTPAGATIQVQVPENLKPGDVFQVAIPADPAQAANPEQPGPAHEQTPDAANATADALKVAQEAAAVGKALVAGDAPVDIVTSKVQEKVWELVPAKVEQKPSPLRMRCGNWIVEQVWMAVLVVCFTSYGVGNASDKAEVKLVALAVACGLLFFGYFGKVVESVYAPQHEPVKLSIHFIGCLAIFVLMFVIPAPFTAYLAATGADLIAEMLDLGIEFVAAATIGTVILILTCCCAGKDTPTLKEVWEMKMELMREKKSCGGQAKYLMKNWRQLTKDLCHCCCFGPLRLRTYTFAVWVVLFTEPFMAIASVMWFILRLFVVLYFTAFDPAMMVTETLVCLKQRRRLSNFDYPAFHPQWEYPGMPRWKVPFKFTMPRLLKLPSPPLFEFPFDIPNFMPRLPKLMGFPDMPELPNVDFSKFLPDMPDWDVDFPCVELTCFGFPALLLATCEFIMDIIGDIVSFLLLFLKAIQLAEKTILAKQMAKEKVAEP
jgi:hypothetical protein